MVGAWRGPVPLHERGEYRLAQYIGTRAADASRVMVMGCMTAIADAVMRMLAEDIPSIVSLHYSGTFPGSNKGLFQFEAKPFGLDVSTYQIQSEDLQLTFPELNAARTLVLDYFTAQKELVSPDHTIFDFDKMRQAKAAPCDHTMPVATLVPCQGPEWRTDRSRPLHLVTHCDGHCSRDLRFTASLLHTNTIVLSVASLSVWRNADRE